MKYILITLMMVAAILFVVGLRRALRTYLKFRGKRLVSCPENAPACGSARWGREGREQYLTPAPR